MYKILDSVNYPSDLKKLSFEKRLKLCEEIRRFLVSSVSKTGGHLASNLGVVELTLAILKVFDMPNDKIIFDVGHQSYVYKILTGRKDKFDTLRCEGGLSGFPKTTESEYDFFNTGHSSTSVSAALGLARARDLSGENYNVIALIGDGALTGGLAYEALCDAAHSNTNLIVILNDNEMSVTKNVGGVGEYLSKIRTQSSYVRAKSALERLLIKLPFGKHILSFMRKFKNLLKRILIQKNFFEEMGFTYLGTIDGHNLKKVEKILERAKRISGPVLLHISTIKGKGYAPAEAKPQNFHGISKFDIDTGELIRDKLHADYSAIFGKNLSYLARFNDKIVAISPAMILGSGLKSFAKAYPNRTFDVGIAESHAVTSAAGLAISGYIPVVCIYSSFLQRAYDQIIHDVAMQNLHVVFAIDRAGVVGADGETHQGVFDIAFLNPIPNIAILSPSCFEDIYPMLDYAINTHTGPICIRYPRGNSVCKESALPFVFSKADVLLSGNDITIISTGPIIKNVLKSAKLLEANSISAEVINVKTIKPLDSETIIQSIRKTKRVIVVEDGQMFSGLGSAVEELIFASGEVAKLEKKGFNSFLSQATPQSIYEKAKMSAESIAKSAIKMCRGDF